MYCIYIYNIIQYAKLLPEPSYFHCIVTWTKMPIPLQKFCHLDVSGVQQSELVHLTHL